MTKRMNLIEKTMVIKRIYVFLIGCFILFSICTNCTNRSNSDFVRIEGDHFEIENDTFFPLMLNYMVSFQSNGNCFIVEPSTTYDSLHYEDAVGKKAVKDQLMGHFGLIKDLGFNTVRICFDRVGQDEDGRYFYQADRKFYLDKKKDRKAIFRGLDRLLTVAEKQGLKVMLLIKPPFVENNDLQIFTKELLNYFKNCPTLFAYDFMNEPIYFDPCEDRKKMEAVAIVSQWKKMMLEHAPHQLFTIGFSEPIETFEWDCSVLPVDFVEVHTYHPLRVPSEIYWFSRHCGKPWMIGETGLPADNDSITYEAQAQFVREAYQLTRDAGGCGFGLWEFQENPGGTYEASYTGLLRHGGETHTTRNGDYTIKGTLKPAARVIATLEQNYRPKMQILPANYYNMVGYKNIRIKGRILDTVTGAGIEGAVIRGWNENWSVGMNTYSDENGCFELYCNDPCTHFEISAAGYSKIKFDRSIDFVPLSKNAGDIHNLPQKELEYHMISYHPFVKKEIPDTCFFKVMNFDPELFHQAIWEGDLGTCHLDKLDKPATL